MQLKEVTVTYGGKLNLGDYNSAHVEVSLTALADEGETVAEVAGALFTEVKIQVRNQVREVLRKQQEIANSVLANLPADVQAGMEK